MNQKESINLYRGLSMGAIAVTTFGITAVLAARSHLLLDEWICLLFLDVIYLLVNVFELEYERRRKKFSNNNQTNFVRYALTYACCCLFIYLMTYLPEFFRPVILIPILLCAVSNVVIAMSAGMFLSILLALAAGQSFYALACYGLMVLLGAVLSQTLKEKEYRRWIALLLLFLNLMIPGILYYLSYKEVTASMFLYNLVDGVLAMITAYFVFGKLWQESEAEIDNRFLDVVSEDYTEVKALKHFSRMEYAHAKKVSDLAYRCAKIIGCNENLCLAAGFYYRMGRWLGEPYNENAIKKAESLCFPELLITILSEYYGEDALPSTPESALVQMIDASIIKLEAMEKNVGKSQWNRDMLIYQTLNEYSSTGMYDKSGMSMNQFLKVRDYLAKEDIL